MHPRWAKGKTEQEANDILDSYTHSVIIRERLEEILSYRIDQSLRQMKDAVKGNIQNLSEYYAEELARQQAFEEVIKLIK